jgi:hypothetical protein
MKHKFLALPDHEGWLANYYASCKGVPNPQKKLKLCPPQKKIANKYLLFHSPYSLIAEVEKPCVNTPHCPIFLTALLGHRVPTRSGNREKVGKIKISV